MTIIAGFKCSDGIVLCADTQETIGSMKRNVPKLRFEPSEGWVGENNGDALAVAFCGAGNGPFIDNLVEACWQAAKTSESTEQALERITGRIEKQYEKFGLIYQPGYCPSVELIFGVKMYGASRLFFADGPLVNEVKRYQSGGIGTYIADFLASRMYGSYLNVYQCVILAAYILFQAKEHADGCGGESHIAVLREQDESGIVGWSRVKAITELVQSSDEELARMLLHVASLEVTDAQFGKRYDTVRKLLTIFRERHRDEIEKWDVVSGALSGNAERKLDPLGFRRSNAQKSEPEQ